MRKITFGDVHIGDKAKKNVMECLENNSITMGEKVWQFEKRWGEVFGYKYNKAVCSGTAADLTACLTLYDLGAKRGDEIIVPALSFIATANAVLAAGFTPVFCDIDRRTLNLDETKVESLITNKTRAVIAVSTMGKPCKMDVLQQICQKHNLLFICDDCEGHGCTYHGKLMGEWADVATYSCYAAHLIFSGEMGVVSTNQESIANTANSTRTHGRKNGDLFFNHERFGWNSKPTNIHCSIGLESLDDFWGNFRKRKDNLYFLINNLAHLNDQVYFNAEDFAEVVCPHAFSMVLKEDNEERFYKFYHYLESKGIQCKVNFMSIPTQQLSFSWMGYKLGDFPEAEFVGRNGLHFGCHQFLTVDDLGYIVETVTEFFKK